MQPNSAPPAPPPAPLPDGSKGQYDFILNPNNAPKKGLANISQTQRILMVVGGGVFVLVIIIVLFSVVFKSSGGAVVELTDLAEQQTEIARVADIGLQKGTSGSTKNFAHTAKLTMLSGQQETLSLLRKSGHKLGEKQLALKTNPATTQELEAASANSTFDTTFTRVMHDELTSYRSTLQTYYRTATSNNEKVLLQDSFSSVTLLVGDNQTF